jgi:hypothetical protein
MNPIFSFFHGSNAMLMASVVAFVSFFLIARIANARQGVALAFGLAPLLAIFVFAAAVSAIS